MSTDLFEDKKSTLNIELTSGKLNPTKIVGILKDSDYCDIIDNARKVFILKELQANSFSTLTRAQTYSNDSQINNLYTAQNITRLLIETTPLNIRITQDLPNSLGVQVTPSGRLKIEGLEREFDVEKIILGACFNSSEGLPYLHTNSQGFIVSKTLLNFNQKTLNNLVASAFEEFERTHKIEEFEQNKQISLEPIPNPPEAVHFAWISIILEHVEDIITSIYVKKSFKEKAAIKESYGFHKILKGMLLDASWKIEQKHIDVFNQTFDILTAPNLMPIFHYLNYMELRARSLVSQKPNLLP